MAYKNYSEKLKDPRWQKKRLEIFQRDKFTCQSLGCGSTEKTLHIHHLIYQKGLEPWEYNEKFLLTLCEDCHADIELRQPEQCDNLLQYFKANLKDPFIRQCCVELFAKSIDLHRMVYLLWELVNDEKETAVLELLERVFSDHQKALMLKIKEDNKDIDLPFD